MDTDKGAAMGAARMREAFITTGIIESGRSGIGTRGGMGGACGSRVKLEDYVGIRVRSLVVMSPTPLFAIVLGGGMRGGW